VRRKWAGQLLLALVAAGVVGLRRAHCVVVVTADRAVSKSAPWSSGSWRSGLVVSHLGRPAAGSSLFAHLGSKTDDGHRGDGRQISGAVIDCSSGWKLASASVRSRGRSGALME
jgi:hypothetical protein